MAKEPADRFATPAELAAALAQRAVVPAAPVTVRVVSPPPAGAVPAPLAIPVTEMDTLVAGTTPPEGAHKAPASRLKRRFLGLLAAVGCLALLGSLLSLVLSGTGRDGGRSAATPPHPAAPEKTITNSIGMKLVYVPPGTFRMGSTPDALERFRQEPHTWEPEVWDQLEGPQHEVRITRGFYLGAYEVKQSEYQAVTGKNPTGFTADPNLPVEQVSWGEAVDYCKQLSERPAEKKAGRVYRLPTEAEWEYACRAGTATAFHGGDGLSSKQANFNGTAPFGGAPMGPNLGKTTLVGAYPANAFGLYDMHGSLWEWCQDSPRRYTAAAVNDPRGPEAVGGPRVLRGGSWYDAAWACRSALRFAESPSYRSRTVGFRVALPVP